MKTNLSTAGVACGLIIAIAVCAWVITMRSSYGTEIIPPAQYDKPFAGRLIHEIVATDQELAMSCGPATPGFYKHACAYSQPELSLCVIYTLPDETLRSRGLSLREVLRHELGHCNGWKHEEDNR
jgi:hypothetical protein